MLWCIMRNCKICGGHDCRGGGDLRCARRDSRPSALFGILDTYGGLRFVVTAGDIAHHRRCDETAIQVPELVVHEPIAWGDIPFVTARITRVVDEYLEGRMPNEPHVLEAAKMYALRKQEHTRRTLDLSAIVET